MYMLKPTLCIEQVILRLQLKIDVSKQYFTKNIKKDILIKIHKVFYVRMAAS